MIVVNCGVRRDGGLRNCIFGRGLAKYLVAALVVASFPALAHESPLDKECFVAAKTQMAMNSCANAEAARVDKELNEAYRKLLAETKDQPDVTVRIREMERAWLAYRDRYMVAMYPAKDKQAEYGSMYPMDADLLKAKLTGYHLAALRLLLEQYGPPTR